MGTASPDHALEATSWQSAGKRLQAHRRSFATLTPRSARNRSRYLGCWQHQSLASWRHSALPLTDLADEGLHDVFASVTGLRRAEERLVPPWPCGGCLSGQAALSTCFWWWCRSLGGGLLAGQLLPSSCLGLRQGFLCCPLPRPCSLFRGVGARGLPNRASGRRHLHKATGSSWGGLWELGGSCSLGLLWCLGGGSLGGCCVLGWRCRRDPAGLGSGSRWDRQGLDRGWGWRGLGERALPRQPCLPPGVRHPASRWPGWATCSPHLTGRGSGRLGGEGRWLRAAERRSSRRLPVQEGRAGVATGWEGSGTLQCRSRVPVRQGRHRRWHGDSWPVRWRCPPYWGIGAAGAKRRRGRHSWRGPGHGRRREARHHVKSTGGAGTGQWGQTMAAHGLRAEAGPGRHWWVKGISTGRSWWHPSGGHPSGRGHIWCDERHWC